MLSLQRQQLLSDEEIKQPTRPRIVIEKMADINESRADPNKPEGFLQRKNVRENDDDDDVVMDNKKSPRHNGDGVPEGLVNGSKFPLTSRKVDDAGSTRPGTATEDKRENMDDKRDIPSRPISANIDDTATLISQRSSSAVNNDKEKKGEQPDGTLPSKEINVASMSGEMKKPSSPYNTRNALENVEQSLKTPPKSSDNSRSATPSYQSAEQDRNPDRSRSSTPGRLEPPGTAESKTPVKSPDKSRSSTPAGLESSGNAELESKTPDKSRTSTPSSQLASSPNTEREPEAAASTPNRSRFSTPRAGIEPSDDEAFAEPYKPSENRDKFAESDLRMKEPSRPASSLSLTGGGKSPKSPRSPTNRDQPSGLILPKSPDVKGYDNGQLRTLSSTRLPKSPVDSGKQTEDGKKKTSFVEDSAAVEKAMEMANRTSTAITKPTSLITPRAQSMKLDGEKAEKRAAEKKDRCWRAN